MTDRKSASGNRVFSGIAALLFLALGISAPVQAAADRNRGHDIYLKHCSSCHGVDGRSPLPTIASLNLNQGMMQPDVVLLNKFRMGVGQMPPFFGILSDKDLLDVIAYMRTTRF